VVTLPTRVKERIFVAVLAVLVVWPLAHYALVRSQHIDQWRFCGFAMYCRPAYIPKLQFGGTIGDQPLSQDRLRAALGSESARVDRFIARRKLWGDLARPDDLASLILERIPELQSVTITLLSTGLEPGADYLSTSSSRYLCTRAGCTLSASSQAASSTP
jgi:hypothetical protein